MKTGRLEMSYVSPVFDAIGSSPEVSNHARRALASRKDPVPVVRTFDGMRDAFGGIPYREEIPASLDALVGRNCHIGQRKLALALIEFLAIVYEDLRRDQKPAGPTKNAFVVYPGSSLVACITALKFWPDARFVCFDPDYEATVPAAISDLGKDAVHANVHIVDGADVEGAVRGWFGGGHKTKRILLFVGDKAGMYCDDTHERILPAFADAWAADHALAFTSDIRSNAPDGGDPGEVQISHDMCRQAVWTAAIGAKYFMHKFRMPFPPVDPEIMENYRKMAETVGGAGPVDVGPLIPYLKGTLYIQLYSRRRSAEMRLVGTGGTGIAGYDPVQIEETMHAYNAIHRNHTSFTVPGLDQTAGSGTFSKLAALLVPVDAHKAGVFTYEPVAEIAVVQRAVNASDGVASVADMVEWFDGLFRRHRMPKFCAASSVRRAKGGGSGDMTALHVVSLLVTLFASFSRR